MIRPRVSVIVPVYNVEQYIQKCVESILNQDYENLEIILVDDGSKDNSGIICEQYKENDHRIRIIHKKNGGLSDARNAGADIATGDYILFLDGDDYVDRDYVSSLMEPLIRNNATMACSPLIFEYANGKKKSSKSFKETVVGSENMIDIVFRATYSIGVSACSKIMRIDDVRKHLFPVGKYHEDMITIEDIIRENEKIVIVPRKTYHYVQRKTSITYADVNFDSLNYGLKYLEKKTRTTSSTLCKNAYVHRMFGLMNTYCRVIETQKYRDELKNCQNVLKRNMKILIKDNKTSITDKLKSIMLSWTIGTFAMLQKIEKHRVTKIEQ